MLHERREFSIPLYIFPELLHTSFFSTSSLSVDNKASRWLYIYKTHEILLILKLLIDKEGGSTYHTYLGLGIAP